MLGAQNTLLPGEILIINHLHTFFIIEWFGVDLDSLYIVPTILDKIYCYFSLKDENPTFHSCYIFADFYSRRKPLYMSTYINPLISAQPDISGTNLLLEPKSIMPISKAQAIVGLSGAEKLARRQHGEKKCDPRERGRNLEHRAARWQRGG